MYDDLVFNEWTQDSISEEHTRLVDEYLDWCGDEGIEPEVD